MRSVYTEKVAAYLRKRLTNPNAKRPPIAPVGTPLAAEYAVFARPALRLEAARRHDGVNTRATPSEVVPLIAFEAATAPQDARALQ
ncbi:MAG TPA: hypothetical protein VN428_07445 [Bryobacteraceae bacterium]|nr:hypothetical protein [Bryobacteraceae bacterium]